MKITYSKTVHEEINGSVAEETIREATKLDKAVFLVLEELRRK